MGYLTPKGPIPFAHRGGAAVWPENTDVAFRGALDLGFRYIETDVHLSRDGELVCFHDSTVQRTTDRVGLVSAFSVAELKRMDHGYRFSADGGRTFPFRGQGVSVLTLAEAFRLHPRLCLNVEIKSGGLEAAQRLSSLIEELEVHDRILVAAGQDHLMTLFRRVRRQLVPPTSPGLRGVARFWVGARSGLDRFENYPYQALQIPVRYRGIPVVTRALLHAARRHHLAVHVWTIDEPAQIERLLDLGVDGIMTDRPQTLKTVFERRGLWTREVAMI